MTWSAPSEVTSSTLWLLHTPVTSAPSALAICTANVPTPPPAPLISTVIPGWTFPLRSACNAVTPACGAAAACSKVRFAGFGTIRGLGSDDVLGERADDVAQLIAGSAEHLIADSKAGHAAADRLHAPGEVPAGDRPPRPENPGGEPQHVRDSSQEVPVSGVHRRRMDPYQYVGLPNDRLGDVAQLQPVRRAVPPLDYRFQARPPGSLPGGIA